MPRGFSEEEFDFYREKLLSTGGELFGKYGLSGVSIDTITKEVGIAKGSFYKFFRNKEELCFEVMMQLEKKVREDFGVKMQPYMNDPGKLMKELTLEIVHIIETYPLLKIFSDKKEMQTLLLRVSPEKQQANFSGDTLFAGEFLSGTGVLEKSDPESITAYMWAMILLTLNSDFFNGQFDRVINLISDMAASYFKK